MALKATAARKASAPRKAAAPAVTEAPSEHFLRLHEFVIQAVRQTQSDALSFRQLAVLTSLRLGSCTPGVKDLADYLKVSKPAITRAVDRLSDLKLTERTINALDRRTISITLTTKGMKLATAMNKPS